MACAMSSAPACRGWRSLPSSWPGWVCVNAIASSLRSPTERCTASSSPFMGKRQWSTRPSRPTSTSKKADRTNMSESSSTAKLLLWPDDPRVVVRACFLYVGQGSCLLFLVRDGETYRVLLADCNLDEGRGGIDVPALLADLSDSTYAVINTHPHDHHLRGVKEIRQAVTIERVWHSGHNPGRKAGNYYADLTDLM